MAAAEGAERGARARVPRVEVAVPATREERRPRDGETRCGGGGPAVWRGHLVRRSMDREDDPTGGAGAFGDEDGGGAAGVGEDEEEFGGESQGGAVRVGGFSRSSLGFGDGVAVLGGG